jgi:K+-transporting ATPase ATPase C chain
MRELRTAAVAAVVITLALGIAYPLALTGAGQAVFPGRADGSMVKAGGKVVGSRLIGQDFSKDPRYFQSRPSVTDYAPAAMFFDNQGPSQDELAGHLKGYVAAYLKRERPYTKGLTASAIPADAVTSSASGVDPQISAANARIQANRVARLRGMPLARVLALVDASSSRPLFGLAGPRSVNVLELNISLDREAPR